MSKLGLLQKAVAVSQHADGICSRRTDTMFGAARRRLSSSNIFCFGMKSSVAVSKPKLLSVFQRRNIAFMFQTPCACSRFQFETPHRQMSMLDVFRRKKKEAVKPDEIAREDGDEEIPGYSLQVFSIEEEKVPLSEEEIEAKRNKSRLREYHRRLVHGEMAHLKPVFWTHHTVKYKQRMYGIYGEKSGVNPGLMWPTKDELKEQIEYEKICNPFTIQEMVRKKQELRAAEKAEFERREKEVDDRMKLVDKFKEELFAKQRAKENELDAAKDRREKLMEEVRRHFGYTVDPKDDRFKELLEKKEKEQRKNMKEARKLEKQQRILEKLEVKKPPTAREEKPKLDDGYGGDA